MGRLIERLSALAVSRTKTPGYHPDGAGLYLQVSPSGSKSWIFRFKSPATGRIREMGLGAYPDVPLAGQKRGDGEWIPGARDKAADCRRTIKDGADPIDARADVRLEAKLKAAEQMTFSECAERYIAAQRKGWRNAKHAEQWGNTLRDYASAVFGEVPVQRVSTDLVMRVLEPIWSEKPETASRIRGRIEAILDWAKTRGLRTGENPARWKGHLQHMLAKRSTIAEVEHHPALRYDELGAFLAEVRKQEGIAALALEFTVLTAVRTGETIGATWAEIDLEERLWIIPSARMKGKLEHRVPLSDRAMEIVRTLEKVRTEKNPCVFPGKRATSGLSNMAMLELLRRMEREDITVHGFRSTFRDWAAEKTDYPPFVVEKALAHRVSDKVEAAYRRGDLFEKRKLLMVEWASFCATIRTPGDNVVPIRTELSAA